MQIEIKDFDKIVNGLKSVNAIRVLLIMLDNENNGVVNINQKDISVQLNTSKQEVSRNIAKLIDLECIGVHERIGSIKIYKILPKYFGAKIPSANKKIELIPAQESLLTAIRLLSQDSTKELKKSLENKKKIDQMLKRIKTAKK